MPAEWERHRSTWLSWPKDPLTFPPGEILETVEQIYVRMISALSQGELVNVLVDDEHVERRVRGLVDGENISFHQVRTADVWIRDYGPIFVRSSTCITTEQCLLNKNRNPTLSRKDIERYLGRYLGFTKVIWLSRGISGDDTDGHVDDLTRFVGPATVITMVEEDSNDENHQSLTENLARLKSSVDSAGRPLRVMPLKMPRKKLFVEDGFDQQGAEGQGSRLPASYANFYVGNSTVLVPTFDDVHDGAALDQLSKLFPTRRVIGINCERLVYGFGGIHCVTQQQPV